MFIQNNNTIRLSKSYDKHAEKCFGLTDNRNNESLCEFKARVVELAQTADEVIQGSYRYNDPAYIFLKEINGKPTAVLVNATDNEYITTINPTQKQLNDLKSNKNIGLDTRPAYQVVLRIRGPKK